MTDAADIHVTPVTPALAPAVRALRVAADQYPYVGDVTFNLIDAERDPLSDAMVDPRRRRSGRLLPARLRPDHRDLQAARGRHRTACVPDRPQSPGPRPRHARDPRLLRGHPAAPSGPARARAERELPQRRGDPRLSQRRLRRQRRAVFRRQRRAAASDAAPARLRRARRRRRVGESRHGRPQPPFPRSCPARAGPALRRVHAQVRARQPVLLQRRPLRFRRRAGRAGALLCRCGGCGRRLDFDLLFGPAYKGIPLATALACEYARRGRDLPLAFNRKEAKAHGEGGSLIGAPLDGRRVLIVDDVITAGTAIREALAIIGDAGGTPAGIVIALDRQEVRGRRRRSRQRLRRHRRSPPSTASP